jgi:hypothetical protein
MSTKTSSAKTALLLDRTGAPDSMWFLAQDYLAHVHNLSANRQINWQIPQQLSKGPWGTPDIFNILMFIGLNLFCIWIQLLSFQKLPIRTSLDSL